ncbi:hypothetical protein [Corynebacterium efficiens YS-314]|uniref:Uncharacterized protein n=1 Tax=Corynebacterium efficiens (strain DSM 44549 / YS-314 / AJ 12310 / JCM 11189 / NBRC 100395) TaxID=196164 RepID=Q8CM02_COREF|nr:hypothetical protein [Corynebacterium efficiens YS-314]BAC18352.1 hypothetical protein [Corynebacterium efficiens YS-314]
MSSQTPNSMPPTYHHHLGDVFADPWVMIHPITTCWWQPHPGSNTNNPPHEHSPWWVY